MSEHYVHASGARESAAGGRWATACAAVVVGVVLLAGKPTRTWGIDAPAVFAGELAASHDAPVAGFVPPAIADPKLCSGCPQLTRTCEPVATVAYHTARRTALCRWGGLYGP